MYQLFILLVNMTVIQKRQSNMKKYIYVIFLVVALVVGYNAGLLSQNTNDKQNNNINEVDVYPNVPKNKLSITSDFYTVEIPKYDYEIKSLKMNIQLNSTGKQYLFTSLFTENYTVNITLKNNETGEEYYVSKDYTWNINEVFNIEDVVDFKEIKDKDLLKAFEYQLNRLTDKKEHNIQYVIEVYPQINQYNVMRFVGMLSSN